MWQDTKSTFTNQLFFFFIHQQTYREGDHGQTPIHDSLKESKIFRNKANQNGKDLYNENVNVLEKRHFLVVR